jgi:hypothetical protein
LRVLIDAIVSGGTSSEFIDELKNRIAYELTMIEKFKAESYLMLTFDVSKFSSLIVLVSCFTRTLQEASGNLLEIVGIASNSKH